MSRRLDVTSIGPLPALSMGVALAGAAGLAPAGVGAGVGVFCCGTRWVTTSFRNVASCVLLCSVISLERIVPVGTDTSTGSFDTMRFVLVKTVARESLARMPFSDTMSMPSNISSSAVVEL